MTRPTFLSTRIPLVAALVLGLVLVTSACDILEVDNPNSLIEEDLDNPSAAPAIANGSLATLTDAAGSVLAPYSTATDELTWMGTRDAWEQLVFGEVSDPLNEFADDAFRDVAEARWTADEAIDRLEGFREEGLLEDTEALIRSYVYGAAAYLLIADAFDDFAFSDRREAAPPVGPENMDELHIAAIDYLDSAVALAQEIGDDSWETRALAVRARAHHALGLWQKLNPLDAEEPLVESTEAAADAEAVLDRVEGDWTFVLSVEPGTPSNSMAYQVNERRELRIGDTYVEPTSEGHVERVRLLDPIDETPPPHLEAEIEAFMSADQYADITLVSAREMYLILAEDALARGDEAAFEEHVNALRGLDELSSYDGQVPARELLEHSRQVNLFLQGRRLADHYRFDAPAPEWGSSAEPGAFFPITITEIRANPHVDL